MFKRILPANILLGISWLWLYRPVFTYLQVIFQREDFRTNQIVLLLLIVLLSMQVRDGGERPFTPFLSPPHKSRLPLLLLLGASAAFLAVERWLNVNTISAALCFLSGYGLLGLWMSPAAWRKGLPAALLLVGVLPFGEHLQTFVGYPLRYFSAELVRQGLDGLHIASLGTETILVLENGVALIDSPCSGIKSVWTGTLFFLAAIWLEKRPLRPNLLPIYTLLITLLLLSNTIRIALLVLAGQVMNWPTVARLIHLPLGVLGFALACIAVLMLVRRLPAHPIPPQTFPAEAPSLTPILLLILWGMAVIYTPRPPTVFAVDETAVFHFPAEMQTELSPLKADEEAWFKKDGADTAVRYTFQWHDLSGSMILVSSHTWRAHHRPERCFEVYGLAIERSVTFLVDEQFPVKQVVFANSGRQAAYWFQTDSLITDDYGTRIWHDLPPERSRWLLVSILFDDKAGVTIEEENEFYRMVERAVHELLLAEVKQGAVLPDA